MHLVAVLKELLNDVIPEDVLHQLKPIGLDFSEHLFLLVAVCCLELVLDKS